MQVERGPPNQHMHREPEHRHGVVWARLRHGGEFEIFGVDHGERTASLHLDRLVRTNERCGILIKTEADDRIKKNADAQLKAAGEKLTFNLSDVEDDIYQVKNQSGQDPLNFPIRINNRMANLLSIVQRGDGAPTGNLPALFEEYKKLLSVQTGRFSKVITTDLTAFNAELRRLGLPTIAPPCATGQTCNVVP